MAPSLAAGPGVRLQAVRDPVELLPSHKIPISTKWANEKKIDGLEHKPRFTQYLVVALFRVAPQAVDLSGADLFLAGLQVVDLVLAVPLAAALGLEVLLDTRRH